MPESSSEVRLGGQGPALRSALALTRQVTPELQVDFAVALTRPGLRRAGCVSVFAVKHPAVPARGWHWRHLCKGSLGSPGAALWHRHRWGNGTAWGHCSVTWRAAMSGWIHGFNLSQGNVISCWERGWWNVHVSFSLISTFPVFPSLLDGPYSDDMKAVLDFDGQIKNYCGVIVGINPVLSLFQEITLWK